MIRFSSKQRNPLIEYFILKADCWQVNSHCFNILLSSWGVCIRKTHKHQNLMRTSSKSSEQQETRQNQWLCVFFTLLQKIYFLNKICRQMQSDQTPIRLDVSYIGKQEVRYQPHGGYTTCSQTHFETHTNTYPACWKIQRVACGVLRQPALADWVKLPPASSQVSVLCYGR